MISSFYFHGEAETTSSILNLTLVSNEDIYNAENKILIISCRNFTITGKLSLNKGLHPENKRFFFIAAKA